MEIADQKYHLQDKHCTEGKFQVKQSGLPPEITQNQSIQGKKDNPEYDDDRKPFINHTSSFCYGWSAA